MIWLIKKEFVYLSRTKSGLSLIEDLGTKLYDSFYRASSRWLSTKEIHNACYSKFSEI